MGCNCNNSNLMRWCFEFLCNDEEGILCDVGYFYIKTPTINVTVNANDPFEFEEALTFGGVSFDIGNSSQMKIANTGIYEITYIAKTQSNQRIAIALSLNGGAVIDNTIYTNITKSVYGQAIVEVNQTNSYIELIALDNFPIDKRNEGDTEDIVVSVTVEKVCELEN